MININTQGNTQKGFEITITTQNFKVYNRILRLLSRFVNKTK